LATTFRNRLLIKGNLRRAVRKFIAASKSLLEYNGAHPDFPLDLFPGEQRATVTLVVVQLDSFLDKMLFPKA
jgi:hypothetical protein